MNAVTRDEDTARPVEQSYARLDGRTRSALEDELQRWGEYWEEKSEFRGYASASSIQQFLEGVGGGTASDRILCKEMPNQVYWTHQAFLTKLDAHQQEVVWNHYVAALNPEIGRCPTQQEKAWLLGIPLSTFRVRLCRARFALLGIDPDRTAGFDAKRQMTEAEEDALYGEYRLEKGAAGARVRLARKHGIPLTRLNKALERAWRRAARKEAGIGQPAESSDGSDRVKELTDL